MTPDQQVTAIDDVRGRVIQVATGLFAIGALVYTGLNYGLSREGHVTDRYTWTCASALSTRSSAS